MTLPPAKRRRIEAANATLRKPFRSPVIKGRSSGTPTEQSRTAEWAARDRAGPAPSPSKQAGPTEVRNLGRRPSAVVPGPVRKSSHPPQNIGVRAVPKTPTNAWQRRRRELEARNQKLEEEIARLRNEKQSASTASASKGTSGGTNKDELDGLIEKWKAAAQQAAEELYATSRSRVQNMGGLKEIAAMQRRNRAEFLEDLQSEHWNKRSAKDTEYELGHDEISSPPGGSQPDEEPSQEEEKEYTMAAMLQSLNVDLAVIGYDPVEETWR